MKKINRQSLIKKTILTLLLFFVLFLSIISLTSCDVGIQAEDIFNMIYPNIPIFLTHIAASILIIVLAFWLVWIPTKKMIEARRKITAKNIYDADNVKKEAYERLVEAEQKRMQAYADANDIIEKAKKTSFLEHDKIIEEAHKHAEALTNKAKSDAISMENDLINQSNKRIVDISLLASKKILEKEINVTDNSKIVEDFIAQLEKSKEHA